MKRPVFSVLVAVLIVVGLQMPASAHHSFAAAYDLNQPVTVHGVITLVRLQNPHSWFLLEVKDATGKVEKWAFEAAAQLPLEEEERHRSADLLVDELRRSRLSLLPACISLQLKPRPKH